MFNHLNFNLFFWDKYVPQKLFQPQTKHNPYKTQIIDETDKNLVKPQLETMLSFHFSQISQKIFNEAPTSEILIFQPYF